MDFSAFDTAALAEEGVPMHVRNPLTGSPLWQDEAQEKPVTITVAGMDSVRFKKANRANQDRNLKSLNYGSRKLTAEQMEENALELLIRSTLGWDGIEVDGTKLEFSVANTRKLYERFTWLQKQVDEFIGDRSNFLPPSPKS